LNQLGNSVIKRQPTGKPGKWKKIQVVGKKWEGGGVPVTA